jgi:hypothetical protein
MSRNVIIAGAVGVIIIIAAGVYVFTQNTSLTRNSSSTNTATEDSQASPQSSTNDQGESSNAQTTGSIFTLADAGKSQKCTFTYSGSNGSGDGTMYADGNGRGLMKTSVETERGNSGENNTLILSDKVYTWTISNGQTFGMVMDKATVQSGAGSGTGSGTGAGRTSTSTNVNQDFDMQCQSWTVDESVLAVPSNVSFTNTAQ